ncbi:hypothetical protein DB30_07230 [Enhygromyxa salina]|uniref:Uncharacterized protein n=1 Tax=Enhygromyxa salina TaxID=215803 RepID=A0A0C1ZN46_9BACT|nr:hypothetical protein DB30_07230 [Enhygromyxa salina]
MIDPADSLVARTKTSPLVSVGAVVAVVGVASAAWFMFGRGKGEAEDPARVLIVGPTPELAGFLEREGFDVNHLSVGEAIGQGQKFDASLNDLEAMVEYADQHGIGYLALNMAHGEQYDLASVNPDAGPIPLGTTFAVVAVGDLGNTVSYGGVVPEVNYDKPAGEQVGLLLALFGQPEIAKARDLQADNDLMIRFGSAGTVEDVVEYEKALETMRRQVAAWTELAEAEKGEQPPREIAGAYEQLRGWPLANGAVLLASGRGGWRSKTGRESAWESAELSPSFDAALAVVAVDALDQRLACTGLPDTVTIPAGMAVAPAGDALLIPTDRWVADLWVLSGPACGFEKRDQIRRLGRGELGVPRASGRTAQALDGHLMWADAKMRAYRQVRIDGVELREHELRWANDEIVVVPASLNYADAAGARSQRLAAAAAREGGPTLDSDPASPGDLAALPPNGDALVFVRIPAPNQDNELQTLVVPVGRLLPSADASSLAIREVFALPSTNPQLSAIAVVDTPEAARLVRLTVTANDPSWQDALTDSYDLAAATQIDASTVQAQVVAGELPRKVHELAISPTGSHAAWSAPVGEVNPDKPLAHFEIMLLALGLNTPAPVVRMTDNDRGDLRPRFAGPDGELLIFDSAYAGASTLPELEAVRALPVPR